MLFKSVVLCISTTLSKIYHKMKIQLPFLTEFLCHNVNKPNCFISVISIISLQYGRLYNITLGNHEYEKNGTIYTPLLLCQKSYRNGTIFPGNETFEIDAEVTTGIYA